MEKVEEQVLCFRKKILAPYSNEKVFWDSFLWNRIQKELIPIPRSKAEYDYQYKQLVAYSIIKAGNLYLTYKRTTKGRESRLWNKRSLGIGGHINIEDKEQLTLFGLGQQKSNDFFYQAVWRELGEELTISLSLFEKPKLICFVNDDSNDVGKVHFGIVWLIEIGQTTLIKGKRGLSEPRFLDIETLKSKKRFFETWSQLIIDFIPKL